MTFISYAQNFEDVLLWRALGHIEDGFYIDLGAALPDVDSVTRAFYERGWHGINVEPVEEAFRRLAQSRRRDVNLRLAVGEAAGQAAFYVVDQSGLSTLDPDRARDYRTQGMQHRPVTVDVVTLAEICEKFAPADIHFLKIDIEGAELAALSGADFNRFRPWIVLVEATQPMTTIASHQEWEGVLIAAGYVFVWFDGLNRFYVAGERHGALAPHFQAPPNVFDDFVRAADSELARRIAEAEGRSATLEKSLADAAARLAATAGALARSGDDEARQRQEIVRQHAEIDHLHNLLLAADDRATSAGLWVQAMRQSTSWRLTAPLRGLIQRIGRAAPAEMPVAEAAMPALPEAAGVPDDPVFSDLLPLSRPVAGMTRKIHQFHSGCAEHDAITNAMLLVRGLLRRLGYESDIFVEHLDAAFAGDIRPLAELPRHAGYVLLVRHSAGYDAFELIRSLPATKILLYHNITPAALMPANQRAYAALGRAQLAQLRGHVAASLADSEYNAIELRAAGFEEPRACTLLFDLDAMRATVAAGPAPAAAADRPFTVLNVGRLTPSKGQRELLDGFAAFAAGFARPCRLVLIGRQEAANDAYVAALRAGIAAAGLNGSVLLAGTLPDAERDGWYEQADLYVSLSHHEGFGIPLVEAAIHGLPVLAVAAAAVPYTLGDAPAGLLADRTPGVVAAALLALAQDPAARLAIAARQAASIERFRIARQLPRLLAALAQAGAAPPIDPDSRAMLSANLQVCVAGHVGGAYSLAAVNRSLAVALAAAMPGRVRVLPVEGEPTTDIDAVPPAERASLARLVATPAPITGPSVVIAQHYPVLTRAPAADAVLALVFWEESLLPPATVATLNRLFRAVLAPSSFVARALVDSGVSTPIHVVGLAPDLADFADLAARKQAPAAPFTFLHVSSCFPRKGVDVLLAAYAVAFRGTDAVRLVIKGFANPHNDVSHQIAALRARHPDLAEIVHVDAELDRAALLALYRDADAMVLPSRGEGFNIPAAEAMAAGLALVVTGGGGHMDFCNAGNAELVSYNVAPSASHLASPQSLWMEPDAADLARRMRALADRGRVASPAIAAARRTAARLADRAAWAERVREAALDVLLAPPHRPVRIAWVSTWAVRCGVAEYSRNLLDAMTLPAGIAALTVLCDSRTDAKTLRPALGVRPAWRFGSRGSMAGLAAAIAQEDADIVVIQHQPGLIGWDALADLLGMAPLRRRPVVVTLHNTRHLLDIAAPERDAVLAALAGAARVLVHTVADVNFLAARGLAGNVALFPHGTQPMLRAQAARPITPAAAPLIGCYGFFLEGKGIPELIAALARIRATYPKARLRLVNADYGTIASTKEIGACRQAVAQAGLAEAVDFRTDFLPTADSLALLAACDVVALPYQGSRESSSAAMRTALCAGVPVAVTPLALFDEARDAVARLPGLDAGALADGIMALLADVGRRTDIQVAARNWLAERDCGLVAERMQGMLLGLSHAPAQPASWPCGD